MGTGAQNLNKGYIREQDAGFVWGQQGYVIMAGPSGDGGHAGNEHGADGCAFHPQTFDTVVYDNKAYASSRNLGSKAGETIDPTVRLGATLDRLINQIASGPDNPYRARVLSNLRAARGALSGGPQAWPSNVRLALTNVGGNSKGITQSLQQRGIVFIDL
ncbi:MAG: hypothetical protein NTV34_00595, partial [Proteobacteria bacterium]|nr:hypothetical protein [Pseudomonadota bacterium]